MHTITLAFEAPGTLNEYLMAAVDRVMEFVRGTMWAMLTYSYICTLCYGPKPGFADVALVNGKSLEGISKEQLVSFTSSPLLIL
jgi:hypothetical protein